MVSTEETIMALQLGNVMLNDIKCHCSANRRLSVFYMHNIMKMKYVHRHTHTHKLVKRRRLWMQGMCAVNITG